MNKRIALIGKSVLMAGIAESVSASPDWSVSIGENIKEQEEPSVIVLDLSEANSVKNLPVLCSRYKVPVVGINPAESTITVFIGKSQSIHSIQDLILLLQTTIRPVVAANDIPEK